MIKDTEYSFLADIGIKKLVKTHGIRIIIEVSGFSGLLDWLNVATNNSC